MEEENIHHLSKIKSLFVILLALSTSFASIFSPTIFPQEIIQANFSGTVNFVEGSPIEIKRALGENFQIATPFSKVQEKDIIQTGEEGITEIIFNKQNVIRLNTNSKLEIINIPGNKETIDLKLHSGEAWVHSKDQPFNIVTEKTSTFVPSSTANFLLEKGKLTLTTHHHISYLTLHSNGEKINNLVLPNNTQTVIYEGAISKKYKLLTSKKLRKQLKQNLLTKESDWIKSNKTLDHSLLLIDVKIPNIIDNDHFWHPIKTNIEAAALSITFNKENLSNRLVKIVKERFEELTSLSIKKSKGRNIEEETIKNAKTAIKNALAQIPERNQEIIINKLYDQYKYFTSESSLFTLRELLTELKRKTLSVGENQTKFLYEQLLNEVNNIEDFTRESVVLKNSEELNTVIQNLIHEINPEYLSYKEGDMLRSIWFYFLISNTRVVDEYFLETNTVIEDLHTNIALKDREEGSEDLPIEILENHLIIANNLIEKSDKFDLASSYIESTDVEKKIGILPDSFAPKKHLEEFSWLVSQKVTLKFTSSSTVGSKDLQDILKKQKQIEKLNLEFQDSFVSSDDEKKTSNKESKLLENEVKKNFKEIGISLEKENLRAISYEQKQFLITNVKYRDILIGRIKYNLFDDTIFTLESEEKNIRNIFPRKELPGKLLSDNETDSKILTTLTKATEVDDPDDEITTLIKQITKKELAAYNFSVEEKNIFVENEEGTQIMLRRVQINTSDIFFDMTYDRKTKEASNTLVLTEPSFEILEKTKIYILQDKINQTLEKIQRTVEQKKAIIQEFENHRFILEAENIKINEKTQKAEVIDINGEKFSTFNAFYDLDQKTLSKIVVDKNETLAEKNITLKELSKILIERSIKSILSINKIYTENTSIQKIADEEFEIKNAQIDEIPISFIYDIESGIAKNIEVVHDPIFIVGGGSLESVIESVREEKEKIEKAEEEEDLKELEIDLAEEEE